MTEELLHAADELAQKALQVVVGSVVEGVDPDTASQLRIARINYMAAVRDYECRNVDDGKQTSPSA